MWACSWTDKRRQANKAQPKGIKVQLLSHCGWESKLINPNFSSSDLIEITSTAYLCDGNNNSIAMCKVYALQFRCGDQSLYRIRWCLKFVSWVKKEVGDRCGGYVYCVDMSNNSECADCSKRGPAWGAAPQVMQANGNKIEEECERADGSTEKLHEWQSLRRFAPPLYAGSPAIAISSSHSGLITAAESERLMGNFGTSV